MFKEVHVEDIESRAGAPQIAALLGSYRSLAKDGALPSYADFNAESLAEHASNLAVVEPIGGGDFVHPLPADEFENSGVEMLRSKVSQWKSEWQLLLPGQIGPSLGWADLYRPRRPSRHPRALVGTTGDAGSRGRWIVSARRL